MGGRERRGGGSKGGREDLRKGGKLTGRREKQRAREGGRKGEK